MRAVLVAVIVGLTCVAAADEVAPDAKAQARAHFRAGTTSYEAGDYAQAITEYEEAYRLAPLPDLLFNLGQAHRLAGDAPRALAYYEQFLSLKPDGSVSDEAREHVRELRAKVQADAKPTPSEAPKSTEPSTQPAPAAAIDLAAAPAPSPSKPIYKRWWLWTAVGAAVVVVAVGAGVGASQASSTPRASTDFGTFKY